MATESPTKLTVDAQPQTARPRARQKPRAWWVMLILAVLIAVWREWLAEARGVKLPEPPDPRA